MCMSHVMPTKSFHPDIDHIKDSGLKSLPYRTSLKLASSGPKEKDLFILLTRQNVTCCTLFLKKIRIDVNDAVLEDGNEVKSTRRKGNLPTYQEKMETTEDVCYQTTSTHFKSLTSTNNVIIYAVCASSFAVFLGLSILFRQNCLGKMRRLCYIASHRNDNDEFRINDFALESHGSVSGITDGPNTNTKSRQLKQNIHIDDNDLYDYPFN
ncbi:unnamed protein product [Mytilus edulis]|uniref:Uncharacterized protein n=1 Tax=Mytilus edulis TaxID=6550 RepID=A0A8S3QQL3_MYTED|nr:unnamed protein product [Mytilus edulis]